jgi:hypothetical protein
VLECGSVTKVFTAELLPKSVEGPPRRRGSRITLHQNGRSTPGNREP